MTDYDKMKIKNSRLICLNNIDFNSAIYRIMPIDRFIQVLTEEKFPLFRPKNWDDSFENLLLESDFWLGKDYVDVKRLRDSYFGVCWSLTKENDAMWRIYSPDHRSIKIKTSISKIFDPIFSNLADTDKLDFVVGCVDYSEQNEIIKCIESFKDRDFKNDTDSRLIPSTLLLKRLEFKHENEVRFLINKKNLEEDIFKFDFSWINAIDEIEFDPKFDEGALKSYKEVLTKHFRFDEKIIKKSELYKSLKLNIKL